MASEFLVLAALSCTLPEGEAGRRRAEVGRLFANARRVSELPDGVELEFAGDDATARALFDFVMFERQCCAQLRFDLRFIPEHSAVSLCITGAPELVAPIRTFAGIQV